MAQEVTHRFPWDPPAVQPVEETVRLLQRDFAYAVQYTAIMVHSEHDELRLLINTPRGQIVPRGKTQFTDGTTLELQDVGMPQVNVPTMTVPELITELLRIAALCGLELVP